MAEIRLKSTGTIKLFENDNTSSVTIASPASLGGDRTVTLPDASVTLASGTMLATDGDGSSLTGIPVLTGSTNNTITTVTGANAIQGEANLLFDGTQLQINNASAETTTLLFNNTAGGGAVSGSGIQWDLVNTNTNNPKAKILAQEDAGDGYAEIAFQTSPSSNSSTLENRMIIRSSGKVGIGEDDPLGNLHVKSADSGASVSSDADELVLENSGECGLTLLSGTGNSGYINWGDSGDNDIAKILYYHGDNSMRLWTNTAERMRIQSSGNVSIGTSTDAQKLFVYGSHVTDNGLVKVQTSNGTGDVDLLIFYDGNDHECGTISLNATGNSVAYNTSSDYRLKENQVNITDGITRLKQLKPYRFNFIDEPDKTLDGFFAHEAQTVVPEAVHGEKDAMKTVKDVIVNANGTVERYDTSEADWEKGKLDGTFASDSTWEAVKEVIKTQKIDQSKLVPLLVAAVKELTAKVEALENA